jgi:putative ABC transport system substrate-binding protein
MDGRSADPRSAFGGRPESICSFLARLGGNLMGINLLNTELTAKRLELLREMLPRAFRIAVLVNPANTLNTQTTLREVESAARAQGTADPDFQCQQEPRDRCAFAAIGRGPTPFLVLPSASALRPE